MVATVDNTKNREGFKGFVRHENNVLSMCLITYSIGFYFGFFKLKLRGIVYKKNRLSYP